MSLNDEIQRVDRIIRLMSHPELKEAWAALREEMNLLREDLLVTKEALQKERSVSANYAEGLSKKMDYYLNAEGRAYCMPCIDAKRGRFHLLSVAAGWHCHECKRTVGGPPKGGGGRYIDGEDE
jgi:hypothetical protein